MLVYIMKCVFILTKREYFWWRIWAPCIRVSNSVEVTLAVRRTRSCNGWGKRDNDKRNLLKCRITAITKGIWWYSRELPRVFLCGKHRENIKSPKLFTKHSGLELMFIQEKKSYHTIHFTKYQMIVFFDISFYYYER